MSCCSEFVTIGCKDFCSTISLGYNATETGDHTIEVLICNGALFTFTESYTAGNDMTITSNVLNEAKEHDIRILQPSGTYYAFDAGTVTCAKLTTQVHFA